MGSIYFIFAVRFKFLTDSMFSAHSLPSLMPLTEHLINVFTNWRKNHEKKTKLSRVLTHIWHYKINIEKTKGKTKKKLKLYEPVKEGKKFPGNSMKWHFIQFNFMLCNYFVQNVRYYVCVCVLGTTTTGATTNQVESMKHSSLENAEWVWKWEVKCQSWICFGTRKWQNFTAQRVCVCVCVQWVNEK